MYVNGRQILSESLSVNMSHEKMSVRGYATLFEGTGIHHSNSGLQIIHDMYINGFFMILYDLTPDLAASEGHASPYKRRYQDRSEIRHGTTRDHHMSIVSRV